MADRNINVNINITGQTGATGTTTGGAVGGPSVDKRTNLELERQKTAVLREEEKRRTAVTKAELKARSENEKREYRAQLEQARKAAREKAAVERKATSDAGNTWGNAIRSYQFKFNALGNIISNVVSTSVRMLAQLGSSIVTASKDFEFAMSGVRAITMATDVEFKQLTLDAIRLGGATIYTSKQIAGLQEELAKLGFTVPEIRAATDGVVALAAATGEDLSQSALVAGTVIRGFGLAAGDITRVVDVMAQSFNNSALDLYKFSETMKYVAPIASKVGFTVEETTALMSKLADQGIVASQAGTGLRNIMLRLSDANSKLSKAMGGAVSTLPELIVGLRKLKEQGIDATSALKLVDRYSVTAFLGLVGASDKLWESYEQLNESFGIAKKMSEIRMDNFAGSVEKLSGAWDSMVLTVNKGNGVLRIAVDVIRKLIEGVTKLFQSYDQAATIASTERLIEYRKTIDQSIQENNRGYGEFVKLLNAQLEKELITREEYGEAIKDIKRRQAQDANDITNEALTKQLEKETASLPELKRIMDEKTAIYMNPYTSYNEGAKQFASGEMKRATASYNATKQQISDIQSLLDQNQQERIGLLIDYSEFEGNTAEESKDKWMEIEDVRIQSLREGIDKELRMVEAKYAKLIENANHYGLSTKDIYKNMADEQSAIMSKFFNDVFKIDSQLDPDAAKMREEIFDSLLSGKTWKEIQQSKIDESRKEFLKLLAKVTKTEEEDFQPEIKLDTLFSLDKDQQEALKKGFNLIRDELQSLADMEAKIADRRVENSDRVVNQLQQDLQNEIALAEAGFASNVSLKRRELAEAKKIQEQALQAQAQATKRQQQMETILQAANLFTTGTEIVKGFTKKEPTTGWLIGLGIAAAMVGGYMLWKQDSMNKLDESNKFGDGGEIVGAKHSRGGVNINAEGGEFVVNAKAYSRHADLVQAINNDNMAGIYGALNSDLSVSLDDSNTSKMLHEHYSRPKVTYFNGYRVEEMKNRRRVIRNA